MTSCIGFDGSRITRARRTGTESYALELLKRLATLADPDELLVYLNATEIPAELPQTVTVCRIPFRRLWTHGRLSWQVSRQPPAVLFVPSHVIPLRHPRSVVTIHDVAFHRVPEVFSSRERKELDIATRWNIRAATRIIAVSRQTRADLIEFYDIDPEHIVVIHHGVDERFAPVDDETLSRTLGSLQIDRPYLLMVGTLHSRKNHLNAITAFEHAALQIPEHLLVICGAPGPEENRVRQRIARSPMSGRIRYLEFVEVVHLPALYSGADVVMLPSWYEGFGLTALEAMACGTPVLASSTGALPEVCGQAARFVSPRETESMTTAIIELVNDAETRQRYIRLGRARSASFTWERSAFRTLQLLRSVRDNTPMTPEALDWTEMASDRIGRPHGRETP